MIVFGVSGSPYTWRALLALETKGLPYELRMLEEADGGLDSPELFRINPRRTVPTLCDGDVTIADSVAILAYLDRLRPMPPLFGETPRAAGLIWQAVSDFVDHVEGHSKAIVKSFYAGEAEARREEIARDAAIVRSELHRMARALVGPWLMGEQLTAADLVVYPFLKSLFRAAARPEAVSHGLKLLPLSRTFPAIETWMTRVESLPGYDRTYPPGWRTS